MRAHVLCLRSPAYLPLRSIYQVRRHDTRSTWAKGSQGAHRAEWRFPKEILLDSLTGPRARRLSYPILCSKQDAQAPTRIWSKQCKRARRLTPTKQKTSQRRTIHPALAGLPCYSISLHFQPLHNPIHRRAELSALALWGKLPADPKGPPVQPHKAHRPDRWAKRNRTILSNRPIRVAGVGFEPHDLRVMSPTSYQTALPRDIQCRRPGSNRHEIAPTGF